MTDKFATYASTYPTVAAWILAKRDSFEFALAMQEAIDRYGKLTPNQLAAVERCIARDKVRDEARANIPAPTAIDTSAIEKAFAIAKQNGAKAPLLRLGSFKLSYAKPGSRNEGALYVKTRNATYLGKIANGQFSPRPECTEAYKQELALVAADPRKAAIAYGHDTKSCAVCGIKLTDPDSVARGVGPICAAKFGWGE